MAIPNKNRFEKRGLYTCDSYPSRTPDLSRPSRASFIFTQKKKNIKNLNINFFVGGAPTWARAPTMGPHQPRAKVRWIDETRRQKRLPIHNSFLPDKKRLSCVDDETAAKLACIQVSRENHGVGDHDKKR